MKAKWKGVVLADSEDTVVVEGNHYFQEDSIRKEYFISSSHQTVCPWKGTARYYSIKVEGDINENAAWFYPETSEAAKAIEGRIAFWKGIIVE